MGKDKNCRYLLSSLSDYIDGDLSETLCEALESHMADCEDCQIVVNTLEKTVYLYRNASEPLEIPSDVRKRLFKRLDLDEFLEKKP